MGFNLSIQNEEICKAEGNGIMFSKKGAMIADIGKFKYEKILLSPNGGGVLGQIFTQMARKATGEYQEIMKISGSGDVYFAEKAAHISIIELEQTGIWKTISVESNDLLAFTDTCHYGIAPIGVGILSEKGFFTTQFTYKDKGAQVAIKTIGNPLVLQSPCHVDPDALVAWTGPAPVLKTGFSWKTFIGQTSGESYVFEFNQSGQIIIVQPYERPHNI